MSWHPIDQQATRSSVCSIGALVTNGSNSDPLPAFCRQSLALQYALVSLCYGPRSTCAPNRYCRCQARSRTSQLVVADCHLSLAQPQDHLTKCLRRVRHGFAWFAEAREHDPDLAAAGRFAHRSTIPVSSQHCFSISCMVNHHALTLPVRHLPSRQSCMMRELLKEASLEPSIYSRSVPVLQDKNIALQFTFRAIAPLCRRPPLPYSDLAGVLYSLESAQQVAFTRSGGGPPSCCSAQVFVCRLGSGCCTR